MADRIVLPPLPGTGAARLPPLPGSELPPLPDIPEIGSIIQSPLQQAPVGQRRLVAPGTLEPESRFQKIEGEEAKKDIAPFKDFFVTKPGKAAPVIREFIADKLSVPEEELLDIAREKGEVSFENILARSLAETVAESTPLTPLDIGLVAGAAKVIKGATGGVALLAKKYPRLKFLTADLVKGLKTFATTKKIKYPISNEELRNFVNIAPDLVPPRTAEIIKGIPKDELVSALKKGTGLEVDVRVPRFGKGAPKVGAVTAPPAQVPSKGLLPEVRLPDLPADLPPLPAAFAQGAVTAPRPVIPKVQAAAPVVPASKVQLSPQEKRIEPTTPRIEPSPLVGAKPKMLREIAFDISKGLKARIITAKPGKGLKSSIGAYFPGSASTTIRYQGDLDTTAHELAHALDDQYGLVAEVAGLGEFGSINLDSELQQFWPHGSATQTGPRSSLPYKRAEGVAEFLRAYVVNPEEAIKAAPNMNAIMEAKLPPNVIVELKGLVT